MNKRYEFSSKEYFNMFFLRYLIVCLSLNFVFLMLLLVNETLNVVSASIVVAIFTIFIGFLYLKVLGVKSESYLDICSDTVKLKIVKFSGTSSTRMTIRYDADIYIMGNLTGYRLYKNQIEVYGIGEKQEIRRRNSNKSQNKKKVTSIKIPLLFEEKNNFINEIKQIAGGN